MYRVISLFQRERYSERFPAIRTLREQDIFIEADCYCLQIPTACADIQNEEIDIFADTVLRLLGLGRHYDTNQIAELMCVQPDFVRFILCRLREGGFLDDRNRPVKREEAAGQSQERSLKEMTVYAFSVGENFLAFLQTEPLSWENVTERKQKSLRIEIGSTGRTRRISGDFIPFPQRTGSGKPPRRDAFPNMIRNYNELCENHPSRKKIDYREGWMIDCSREQSVILHCKLALQDGHVDYPLLSDGFSVHCEKLLEYVRNTQPEIIQNLLSASVEHTDGAYGAAMGCGAAMGYGAARERYSKLYDCLESRVEYQGESIDEAEEAEQRNIKSLRRLCEAAEWALLYFVKEHPPSARMMALLRGQSASENFDTVQALSKKIGLRGVEKYPALFGRLHRVGIDRCLSRGEPDLGILLPLCVVTAYEDSALSFHQLIWEMPDILSFLGQLNTHAARARHEAGWNGVESSNALEAQTRRFIELLLPDFRPNGGQVRSLDGASQRRLNARVSVSNAIGWDLFQRLDAPLREELLMISPDKRPQDLPPAGEFVFTLSRVLEYVFRSATGRPTSGAGAEKQTVLNEIQSAYGICLSDGLKRVNPRYLSAALGGGYATLNAYYLAFLFRGIRKDRDAVRPFLEPEVSGLIEEISILRGHTAQAALLADEKHLMELREQVFLTVKRLSEL